MIANRTWLYLILVGLFVAFIAVLLQYGDQRFGEEAVVERPAIANRAASADSTAANSSFILGALMNTRGLMELIALNVGYDLGVISAEMFTSLVLMALVTPALLVRWSISHSPIVRTTSGSGPVFSPPLRPVVTPNTDLELRQSSCLMPLPLPDMRKARDEWRAP